MSYTPKSDLPSYLTASGLAHPDTWDAATQTYNVTASSFKNFRLNLAKSLGGVQKCYIYSDGDSITSGLTLANPETGSYTAKARTLMANSGRWGNIYDPGPIGLDSGTSFGTTDGRLSWSGGISVGSGLGNFGLCGACGWGGNSGTWSITFGPVTCDTFEVYDRIVGFGAGSGWNWAIDGGATTFVAQQSTGGDAKGNRRTTISAGSVGSHTLTITAAGANYGIINGIGYRTSTVTSGVVWAKRGVGGSSAGTSSTIFGWNNSSGASVSLAYTGDGTHTHPTPHLVILQLGTNNEADVPTFKTNMGTLISTIQGVGADVLLCVAPPGGAGVSAGQATYLAAVAPACYQLADQYNIGLFDMFWRWGGAATSTMDQYFQSSGSSGHPNLSGHADMGFGLYNALARAA